MSFPNRMPSPNTLSNNLFRLQAQTPGQQDNMAGPSTSAHDTRVPTATSVISLHQSKDVVIGPMTQYQSPVTFNQYMDATFAPQAARNIPTFSQGVTCFGVKIPSWLVASIIIAAGLGGGIYFAIRSLKSDEAPYDGSIDNRFGHDYRRGTIPKLGLGHWVYDREEWGASEIMASKMEPLKHPITYVIIFHGGGGKAPCSNFYECSVRMRAYQDIGVANLNLTDIRGNFYISKDGGIYVGRSWNAVNGYNKHSLAIGFIGDFNYYTTNYELLDAAQHLLSYGVEHGYLVEKYKLIARNQTSPKATSPGVNVYAQISQWPRWHNCGGINGTVCGSELGWTLADWNVTD